MLPPFTPDPVLVTIGPITVYWYGVMYAVGLLAVWLVLSAEVRRRGLDVGLLVNGMIIVAAFALIGGRLYHVIDQWALYQDDPITIILPPYSGLGAFGGLILGTAAGVVYAAYKRQPILVWADAVTPGILIMQAFARWGNFFNQELYGPPTDLPWGIAIDCAHRVTAYPCELYPFDTTRFQPLFLYESLSGLIGAAVLLWVARRFASKLLPGDIALLVFAWYSTTRFLLEPLRTGNWTLEGIPTASIISAAIALGSLAILVVRHLLHRRDEKVAARALAAAAGAAGAPPAAADAAGSPADAEAPDGADAAEAAGSPEDAHAPGDAGTSTEGAAAAPEPPGASEPGDGPDDATVPRPDAATDR
ncbi:MAG: prolipoprotein diacylglyceryl transferase [Chloroflexi bacterium]|jgi:phosphatidylglycerol:prolipoprotein diacylglycerol transferase|nr:prolipoprotein diacylglyceryl transferase [Chloroflexota bacterium]